MMKKIVEKAGYTLSQALEILDRTKILSPFLVGYDKNDKEHKINTKEMILEFSIPKVVSEYEINEQCFKSACIVFPAEIANINEERESVLIIMAQNYESSEQIVISQPYTIKNDKLNLLEFELLDYSDNIEDRLQKLEAKFLKGILNYDGAEKIWGDRLKAS